MIHTVGPFLQFRLGKGDGTFSGTVLDESLPGPVKPVARDLNGDKLADLIFVAATNNDVNVMLNTSPASGADLNAISLGLSPDPVGVGTDLTFKADVLNLGPGGATGVTLADTLPNGANFVSATASQGSCVQSQGVVSCSIGSLASALDSNVTIVVTPTVAGSVTNSIHVTANEPDLNLTNNDVTQIAQALPIFTLSVTKSGNGSGTVTSNPGMSGAINCGAACSATYLSGAQVVVGEIPDANSLLSGWSGPCAGTGACAFTMDGDKTLNANFVLGVNLSVAVGGSGSGSVTSADNSINCSNTGGSCSSLFLPGTLVSLTAVPSGAYVFAGWSGACAGAVPNPCNVSMNSAQSVTATFNPPPDFSLAPAITNFTTQTGAQVTDVLTLAGQNGFAGAVALSCTAAGPPPLPSCNVSLSPVMVGSGPGTSTLTITAPTTLASVFPSRSKPGRTAYGLILLLLSVLFCGIGLASRDFGKNRRCSWLLECGILVLFAILAGCGVVGSNSPPTSQTYTVTVTATSGLIQHSTIVTLTVL